MDEQSIEYIRENFSQDNLKQYQDFQTMVFDYRIKELMNHLLYEI